MPISTTRERIRQIENKVLRKLRHPSRRKILINIQREDETDQYRY